MLESLATLLPGRDRLSSLDAAFLYLEGRHEPLHVGALAFLEGPVAFPAFAATVGGRLGSLPRYRQRPVRPLLDLAAPAWETDPRFDAARHVRQVTVPPPGRATELHTLVDELFAAPLDPERPLWEVILIDGLADGRAGVLTKVHHCMIDGVSGAQVLEVMTDDAAPASGAASPRPAARRPPEPAGLGAIVDAVRGTVAAAAETIGLLGGTSAPLPFNGPIGYRRHLAWTSFPLDRFLAMRGVGRCKVNDVVLAVIAGALRRHLLERGVAEDALHARALVPVSIRSAAEHLTLGNRVSGMLVDLPVHVADAVARLHRVTADVRQLKERGQQRAFDLTMRVVGPLLAPIGPLLGKLSTRLPLVHTVCTNVPGSSGARLLAGRRVTEIQPIVPLALGIGLGFAILSYDGSLAICLNSDPELVPDADGLRRHLEAAVDELAKALGIAPAAEVARGRAADAPPVSALMTTHVLTVTQGDSLARAWELMRNHRIRHLPVTDAAGVLQGLVTHRDLLAAAESSLDTPAVERVRHLERAQVADVMESHVSTIGPDLPAASAGLRMVEHKIGCLPVTVGDGRLVGIVTEEDYVRWAALRMAAGGT